MNLRYPPSILVALYTALLTTIVFMTIRLVNKASVPELAYEMMGFFTASLIIFTIVLEFFLYRRLKTLDALHKKEIRHLQEMEVYRREFIGDVSHELKTPIFAIEGFIETLLDGALEDDKVNRKFLQKAQKHTARLSNLVQDILVITHVESGQLAMKYEKFRIYDLAQDVVDALEIKLTSKGRQIAVNIQEGNHAETLVYADKEKILKVMYNLVDNAIKYGDQKGKILVELKPSEKDPRKLWIQVTDDGPGIEPEHLARLFERFYRVDKSRSRERGGTGLGLAICKHMIEAHKEKIWVESKIGNGTKFTFTLSIAS